MDTIKKALYFLGPASRMLGISEQEMIDALVIIDKMSQKGVSGAEGGATLRRILKELANEQS